MHALYVVALGLERQWEEGRPVCLVSSTGPLQRRGTASRKFAARVVGTACWVADRI